MHRMIGRAVNKFNARGEDAKEWVEHTENRNEYTDNSTTEDREWAS